MSGTRHPGTTARTLHPCTPFWISTKLLPTDSLRAANSEPNDAGNFCARDAGVGFCDMFEICVAREGKLRGLLKIRDGVQLELFRRAQPGDCSHQLADCDADADGLEARSSSVNGSRAREMEAELPRTGIGVYYNVVRLCKDAAPVRISFRRATSEYHTVGGET